MLKLTGLLWEFVFWSSACNFSWNLFFWSWSLQLQYIWNSNALCTWQPNRITRRQGHLSLLSEVSMPNNQNGEFLIVPKKGNFRDMGIWTNQKYKFGDHRNPSVPQSISVTKSRPIRKLEGKEYGSARRSGNQCLRQTFQNLPDSRCDPQSTDMTQGH